MRKNGKKRKKPKIIIAIWLKYGNMSSLKRETKKKALKIKKSLQMSDLDLVSKAQILSRTP
jgi:hypothetical protein